MPRHFWEGATRTVIPPVHNSPEMTGFMSEMLFGISLVTSTTLCFSAATSTPSFHFVIHIILDDSLKLNTLVVGIVFLALAKRHRSSAGEAKSQSFRYVIHSLWPTFLQTTAIQISVRRASTGSSDIVFSVR
eukprot:scaffold1278_cov59-Cyclotella_meneghiniana.AAC.8